MADTSAANRPTTLDHLRSTKRAPESKVPLCSDVEIADAFTRAKVTETLAREALTQAKAATPRKAKAVTDAQRALDDAEAALTEAREAAEQVTNTFRFRAIGRKRYEALKLEHPPTDKQIEQAEKDGEPVEWNVDTFPQAIVAACMVDITTGAGETFPPLDEDGTKALWDDDAWTTDDLVILWNAALFVNHQSRVLDLGKGSGRTPG